MIESRAIPPWNMYAENKSKDLGGSHEEFVAEYHSKRDRMQEILEEKGLMKDVPTPLRNDVKSVRHPQTLVETGLVEELPMSAKHYGMDTPSSFFHIMTYSDKTSETKLQVAKIMGMDESGLDDLYQRVSSVLGEEYQAISNELNRYTK